jgi:hypothetical protein
MEAQDGGPYCRERTMDHCVSSYTTYRCDERRLREAGKESKQYDSTLPGRFSVTECLGRIYSQGTMGEVREFVLVKVPGEQFVSLKEVLSY